MTSSGTPPPGAAAGAPPSAPAGPPHGAPPLPPMVQIGDPYGGRAPMLMGLTWSALGISTALLLGRLYLRVKSRNDGRTDWAMWWAILTWAASTSSMVTLTVAVHHGFGNHIMELSFPNISMALKYMWLTNALCALSSGIAKVSVASFVLMMQKKTHKHTAWILYFIAGTNLALNIVIAFIIMFQCDPPDAAWDISIHPSDCTVRDNYFEPYGMFQSSWNGLSDIVLAVYPTFIIYKLKMAMRVKVSLCVILSLGIVGGVLSFVKLYPIWQMSHEPNPDVTYVLATLVAWGQSEGWVVLIALSIPPIWPLVKPFVLKMASTIGSKGSQGKASHGYSSSEPSQPSSHALSSVGHHHHYQHPYGVGAGAGAPRQFHTPQAYAYATHNPARGRGNSSSDSDDIPLPLHGGITMTHDVSITGMNSYPSPHPPPPTEKREWV